MVVSEHVIEFHLFSGERFENHITPLSVDEFEMSGVFPLSEIISSFLNL